MKPSQVADLLRLAEIKSKCAFIKWPVSFYERENRKWGRATRDIVLEKQDASVEQTHLWFLGQISEIIEFAGNAYCLNLNRKFPFVNILLKLLIIFTKIRRLFSPTSCFHAYSCGFIFFLSFLFNSFCNNQSLPSLHWLKRSYSTVQYIPLWQKSVNLNLNNPFVMPKVSHLDICSY